jgi:hypothetical protein
VYFTRLIVKIVVQSSIDVRGTAWESKTSPRVIDALRPDEH